MSGALYLPGADRTTRWFFKAGAYPSQMLMPRIDKTLWHSTETSKRWGCPGYSGGATAPQVTINPWPGYQKTYQHFPIPRAGRALGNPASTPVSENRDNVFQVEVIGYSDPALGRAAGCYLPELPEAGQQYLAEMIAFVHREWPHPDTLPPTWPLYKVSSWAAMDAAHMTSSEYDRFKGWLAHMHAPRPSTHGDAALPIAKIRAKKRAILAPKPTPEPAPPPAPITKDDTMRIIQVDGTDPQYVYSGTSILWIKTPQEKANIEALWKAAGLDTKVYKVKSLLGLGVLVGEAPPA